MTVYEAALFILMCLLVAAAYSLISAIEDYQEFKGAYSQGRLTSSPKSKTQRHCINIKDI